MKPNTVKECIDYLDEVGELNSIKAQAIREASDALADYCLCVTEEVKWLRKYAEKVGL